MPNPHAYAGDPFILYECLKYGHAVIACLFLVFFTACFLCYITYKCFIIEEKRV